jgi:outer membrane protein insertion porin family
MQKHFFVILIFLFLSGIGLQPAVAQENYEIRKIRFRGNKTLSNDFLLERMALKEVSFFEKVILNQEPFLYSRELVDLDMERLVRIYQSEGFLNAKASVQDMQVNDKRQKLNLIIEIEEGEPVIIDSINILIPTKAGTVNLDSIFRKLNRKPELEEGERFRDLAIMDDIALLDDAYRTMGFAYSQSNFKLDLRPSDLKTSIIFYTDPGPLSYFGETQLTGNEHVSEKFLRRQLIYKEGNLYNNYLLTRTRQSIYKLQLFSVVSVLPERDPDRQDSIIPVRINVREAPRVSTRLGAGYGTEEKFRTFIDMTYRGFLGGARRINLRLRHSALEPYSARLRWIQPQFIGMNTSIALEPFIMRISEPGYNTRSYGIRIPFIYDINRWVDANLTYYYENSEQTLEEGDEEFTDWESDKFPYKKSGFLLFSRYDNSTPQFSPNRGINVAAGFKINGYIMGGDFSYTQLWGDFRVYQEVWEFVLALRLMAGGINSSDASGFIPVEDRFYSGGSQSIRGWNRAQLGPRRESGTPLGGKSIFEGNIELRYPLFWRLSLVGFFDGGNVWERPYHYELDNLGYAAGTGIRVETPIGPVRFDVGVPVWNEKRNPQFFISVGQAF